MSYACAEPLQPAAIRLTISRNPNPNLDLRTSSQFPYEHHPEDAIRSHLFGSILLQKR